MLLGLAAEADVVLLVVAVSGGSQTRSPVTVPVISETTKRSFHQSSPGGSTAVQDQRDAARPLSAMIRSVFFCTV